MINAKTFQDELALLLTTVSTVGTDIPLSELPLVIANGYRAMSEDAAVRWFRKNHIENPNMITMAVMSHEKYDYGDNYSITLKSPKADVIGAVILTSLTDLIEESEAGTLDELLTYLNALKI